jgi:hypothetical protein
MFGKKRVAAQATILADEGYTFARNSATEALQYQKYIVEVHPQDEPAFRTEVKGWVSWPAKPEEGDEVRVLYKPGTHDVELDLKGDPRFDAELRAANQKAQDAARREELLSAPVLAEPAKPDAGASFADLLARHERGELTDEEFRAEEAKLFGG